MPYAGMAELADALDLGSSGQPCGFDSHYPYQLVASDISLATSFFISLQSSSRAHSAAPRFQIEPAALGFDLVLGTNLEAATSILLRYSSSLQSSSCAHAVDRLR